MELSEVTALPKMYLVDCLKDCKGCGGEKSIEIRIDPDQKKAEGYCIHCGKYWSIAERDLTIFKKLAESEKGEQVDRDIMLITKHVVFDLIGVKPYPKEYDDVSIAIRAVLEKFANTVMTVSKQYEILEPHMPLVQYLASVCNQELESKKPDFEPVRKAMTAVVNAHIEATRCIGSLDGGESERSRFLDERTKALVGLA